MNSVLAPAAAIGQRTPARHRLKEWFIRCRSAFAVLALLVLTESVYLRPALLLGTGSLVGLDYNELHIRRIAFARKALFGTRHTIPAWYPHEFLGSPFAANLQSFPWIPTRLVLLLLDPSIAFAAAVAMAAALSAIFTWLYCRRAGLTRTGATAAGVTFACAGYFASRVMAGHLPLLEAYPALPLLLWLVDRALAPERDRRQRFDLGLLALCSTFVVMAGHPQLPAYSVASAILYAAWRGRRWLLARVTGAIVLGAGLAMAVWWPMLLLIGRSTRVLHLAAAANDVVMPWRRLLGLIIPAVQGWKQPVEAAETNPFGGYPDGAYFWDTASYAGILPLVAVAVLLVACVVQRRMPGWRWKFLSCLGTGAFLCSLPLASPLLHLVPGTLLRSPARLLYLWTFCAAAALGAGVDAVRRMRWRGRLALVAAGLLLHFADLWGFAHRFIQVMPPLEETQEFQTIIDRTLESGRIAKEWNDLLLTSGDRYDDAGGYDSIFLQRFNRGLLALAGAPPELNRQLIDGSELPVKALEATGVHFVITTKSRKDLELVGSTDDARLYRVPNAAPRAAFFAQTQTRFVVEEKLPELFAAHPQNRLLLPSGARNYASYPESPIANEVTTHHDAIIYSRPSSDEVVLQETSDRPGFVHLLEAYDPGWAASVDGANAPLLTGNGFAMAIPVPPGHHTICLRYETPGRAVGEALSLLSLGLLIAFIASARPRPRLSD